jgi:hypothetical protein
MLRNGVASITATILAHPVAVSTGSILAIIGAIWWNRNKPIRLRLPETDREWDILEAQIHEKCERGIGGDALKKLYNQLVSYYPNRKNGKLFDKRGAMKVAIIILRKYNIGV